MSDQPFVGREEELRRLDAYLEAALAGQGQVCFVAGEPGCGKTTLVREFARRSQARCSDLLVAVGDCNAQTGAGEAFLPFREVLALLTGDLDAKLAEGAISQEGASRLRKVLSTSLLALVESAPDLIGVFVPGMALALQLAKMGYAVTKNAVLESRLTASVKREPPKAGLSQASVDRENLFEQYSRFLVELAAAQPLLLVLDDLQWIDVSSVDLLFHLTRRIAASRILIAGTYRPADVAAGRSVASAVERHPLDKILSEIKRYRGDITLDLDARDSAAARRFVHALVDAEPNGLLSDFREALYERTGGNPLFVIEMLNDLRERGHVRRNAQGDWVAERSLDWNALPARVEGVIEGRIGRLDKDLRETLAVASVEGEEFGAETVARVMGIGEREAVRRLSEDLAKQHGLVDPAGVRRLSAGRISRYEFHHRLLRKYLYDRLDPAQRVYYHEDVAKALEALYENQTGDVAVQLAWHYDEAGLEREAAAYHRLAGELASARYANAEALFHLCRSLELTPEKDVRNRLELLLAREKVYERQGKRSEQDADLSALAGLAAGLKDGRVQAEVSLRRANLARLTANYGAASTHAQAAVAQAEQAGDKLIAAQGYALVGLVLRHQGSFGEAGEWLELALGQAQSIAEDAFVAEVTYWLGLNQYSSDRLDLARDSAMRARDTYERLENRMGAANCSLLLGSIASKVGDNGEAVRYLEQALEACRRVGWRSREALALGDLAGVLLELGDYETAQRHGLEALALYREVSDREGEAIGLDTLGLVMQQLGRHEEALDLFRHALAIDREIGNRRSEGYVMTHLGYSYLERGDLPGARRSFQEAVGLRVGLADNVPTVVDDLAGLAQVELQDGNTSRAFAYAEEALDRMRQHGADGVEYPARDYLVCYQVLEAIGTPEARARAAGALADGYALLQARAARIKDAARRQSSLANVPFNRELCEAHERA